MKRRMIKVVAALASACMVASSFAGAAFAAEGDGLHSEKRDAVFRRTAVGRDQ